MTHLEALPFVVALFAGATMYCVRGINRRIRDLQARVRKLEVAVCLAAMLFAAPAHADTLLWELIHVGQLNYGPADVPPPVTMTFTTGTIGGSQSSLTGSFTTADNGLVIHATGDTFAGMASDLMSPTGTLSSTTANIPIGGIGMYADDFWTKPDAINPGFPIQPFAQFNTYVPRLGTGLSGYTLTDITQTITDIHWEVQVGGISTKWIGTATHTISIYGHVPEPSSLLLFGFVCCHFLVRRARR